MVTIVRKRYVKNVYKGSCIVLIVSIAVNNGHLDTLLGIIYDCGSHRCRTKGVFLSKNPKLDS